MNTDDISQIYNEILQITGESGSDLYERLIRQERQRLINNTNAEPRFWNKVNKNGPTMPHMDTPCWIWTGAKRPPYGYGLFQINGGARGAHRFSWEIANRKPVPKDMLVCHNCDNPSCVNPDHLFLGTDADNGYDRATKKRTVVPRGEQNHNAKLTWKQVDEIRYKYAEFKTSQYILADEYGVHQAVINAILKGKTWKSEWKPDGIK